jgi:hypothetical protein
MRRILSPAMAAGLVLFFRVSALAVQGQFMPYPSYTSGNSSNNPRRQPKPRPTGNGFQHRDLAPRPNSFQAAPKRQPTAPSPSARIAPLQPKSGKERRRMIKASAWRLARLVQARATDVVAKLAVEPSLERAFPDRVRPESRGEAKHLASKIARLLKATPAT